MRAAKMSEEQAQEAAKLYDEGWTLRKLAQKYDMATSTVRVRILRYTKTRQTWEPRCYIPQKPEDR